MQSLRSEDISKRSHPKTKHSTFYHLRPVRQHRVGERVGLLEHTCRLAEWNAAKNRPDWRRRASLRVADSLPQKASPAAMIVCVHSRTCSAEHDSHPVGLLQGWREVKAQGYCTPDSILKQGLLLRGWLGSTAAPTQQSRTLCLCLQLSMQVVRQAWSRCTAG